MRAQMMIVEIPTELLMMTVEMLMPRRLIILIEVMMVVDMMLG